MIHGKCSTFLSFFLVGSTIYAPIFNPTVPCFFLSHSANLNFLEIMNVVSSEPKGEFMVQIGRVINGRPSMFFFMRIVPLQFPTKWRRFRASARRASSAARVKICHKWCSTVWCDCCGHYRHGAAERKQIETRKQKQTRNKQKKHDMFDLAIPVDIFVQRKIVIGAHAQKRSDKTTLKLCWCHWSIFWDWDQLPCIMPFHLLHNFDPRNKTCT